MLKTFLVVLLTLACSMPSLVSAQAEPYPSKLVRIIVPFPGGGTADALPRIVAEKLSTRWSKPVIIENRPGAGGNIGAEQFSRAEADGYTLMVSPPGPIAVNDSLYKKLAYDPTKFVPVSLLATTVSVLVIRPTLSVKGVQELIQMAKQSPRKLAFASQGNGSTSHLTAAMFQQRAEIEMLHVPYKGSSAALTDLMGGQIDLFFDNISSSLALHRAGKIRILAVAGPQRSSALPDIPTIDESGLSDGVTWYEHPTDTTVDVAVFPYTPPEWARANAFPTGSVLTDFKKQTKKIGPGDIAYVVGIFKLLPGAKRNNPVVHVGHLASFAEGEAIPTFDWRCNKKPCPELKINGYIVQVDTMPQASGSPVFVRRSFPITAPDPDAKPQLIEGTNLQQVPVLRGEVYGSTWLLGLWHGAWTDDLSKMLALPQGSVNLGMGMGVTIPAPRILEVLNQPELMAMRQAKREPAKGPSVIPQAETLRTPPALKRVKRK